MDFTCAVKPVRWVTIEELLKEFPHLRPDLGVCDRVSYHPAGERESPEAARLREGMKALYDDRGSLARLVPKGWEPDVLSEIARVRSL